MKRLLSLLCGSLVLLAPTFAQEPEKPKGYDAFAMMRTRNIFDPNRRPARAEPPRESRAPTTSRRRSSTFALNGTMVTEGRSLAFFSGSRSEYSKVISAGELVGGYKIIAITPAQVELEHEGKRVMLAVGHQMQLEGTSEEVPETDAAAPAEADSTKPPEPPSAPAAAAPTTDKAEILRRMMERRQKEMSK